MGKKIEDQPAPKATNRTPAWELVIKYVNDNYEDVDDLLKDMRERDLVGRQRYGTPLQAGNGRNHLVDAYQEGLDLAVYLRAYLDEREIDPDGLRQPTRTLVGRDAVVVGLFKDTIEMLCDLCEAIA